MVTSMCSARMPFDQISLKVKEFTGIYLLKSAIINMTRRTCDDMEKPTRQILDSIKSSENVGIDETRHKATVKTQDREGQDSKYGDMDMGNPVQNIHCNDRSQEQVCMLLPSEIPQSLPLSH